MKISVQGNYTIAGKITYRRDFPVVQTSLTSDGIAEFSLLIDFTEQSIEATGEYGITQEFYDFLKQDKQPKELPQNIDDEASAIRRHMTSAIMRFLHAVKYCLKQLDLDESLAVIKSVTYSFDNVNWRSLPGAKLTITASSYSITPLDLESTKLIKNHLSSGTGLFIAIQGPWGRAMASN